VRIVVGVTVDTEVAVDRLDSVTSVYSVGLDRGTVDHVDWMRHGVDR